MFWNNVKIALRNVKKNKVFAAINILGLALGMTIYVIGGLIGKYEKTHDAFFANADNIYTLGTIPSPNLGIGVKKINTVPSAVGPLLEAELTDIEAMARLLRYEFLVTQGDNSYYEQPRFVDPELLEIFDFEFLAGDKRALDNPSGLVLTRSAAEKYFGDIDAIGEVLTFDNEFDFFVAAVIEDMPVNSHLNSSMIVDVGVSIMAPMQALMTLRDTPVEGV